MTEPRAGRRPHLVRILGWSAAGLLLLVPLVAMRFTDEVDWTAADFLFAGGLFALAGTGLELAVRASREKTYRAGVAVAIAAAFLLLWINGAVGIIGNEDNPANLLFFAVLATAMTGSILSRFRGPGMTRTFSLTAGAQALVGGLALVRGWGSSGPAWPFDVAVLTVFFCLLWLGAALLFRTTPVSHPGTGMKAGASS